MTSLTSNFKHISYLWICGAKSKSTPLSTIVPELLLSIDDVISPKHSNDSPSDNDEHCDDFVDGSGDKKIIRSFKNLIYSALIKFIYIFLLNNKKVHAE